jgi:hypothetical protein
MTYVGRERFDKLPSTTPLRWLSPPRLRYALAVRRALCAYDEEERKYASVQVSASQDKPLLRLLRLSPADTLRERSAQVRSGQVSASQGGAVHRA